MARAADFDGSANETEVITSENLKGKKKFSILGQKGRVWLLTINNPQNHGISLDLNTVLAIFKDDIDAGRVTYISGIMEQSLTVDDYDRHTPHGHLLTYWPNQVYGGHLNKLLPHAALENCNADTASVRQYILKDTNGSWFKKYPEKLGEKLPESEANFWEWGALPTGRKKSSGSKGSAPISETIMQAILAEKSDSEIITAFPSAMNRYSELRKVRFALMSQQYRSVYRDMTCIYIEANFPPKEIYDLFPHTSDVYVVSDYTHPWDSYSTEKTLVLTNYLGQFSWYDVQRYLNGGYCTLPARFADSVACYNTVIIISPLSFSNMCKYSKEYNPALLASYFTHLRRYLDLNDTGTDYARNPTSGTWERRYLLPPHNEPKKETNSND